MRTTTSLPMRSAAELTSTRFPLIMARAEPSRPPLFSKITVLACCPLESRGLLRRMALSPQMTLKHYDKGRSGAIDASNAIGKVYGFSAN